MSSSERRLPAIVRIPALLLLPALAAVLAFRRAAPADLLEVPFVRATQPPAELASRRNPFDDAASLAEGRALYQRDCRPCHGASAQGDGPLAAALRRRPGPLTGPGALTPGAAFWRTRSGAQGLPASAAPWDSAMPAWGFELSDDEIWKTLLAAREMGEATPSVPAASWLEVRVPPRPAMTAALRERGRLAYDRWCAACHGASGRGDGPVASSLLPQPCDFSGAPSFKLRSTQGLPLDEDLFRSIARGLSGTSMPGWEGTLPDNDLWALVDVVKSFAPKAWDHVEAAEEIPALPRLDEAAREEGKSVYAVASCWTCHGKLGRGDGPAAGTQRDSAGRPTVPTDLTKPRRFKAGRTVREVFRTLACGMGGTLKAGSLDALGFPRETPLTSQAALYAEDEVARVRTWLSTQPTRNEVRYAGERIEVGTRRAWALAAYVVSLGDAEVPEGILRVASSDLLPSGADAEVWGRARPVRVPLAPQALEAPRAADSAIDEVEVRALASGGEVAFLLAWNDRFADRAWPEAPPTEVPGFPDIDRVWSPRGSDAVAIEFPLGGRPEGARPHFAFGDPTHPVRLWIWNAETGTEELIASGPASFRASRPVPTTRIHGEGTFRDGRWMVVLRGKLEAPLSKDAPLPFAVVAWDGASGEAGLRCDLSSWQGMQPEDPMPLGALARAAAAGLGVLLLEWALSLRRPPKAALIPPRC